MPRALFIFLAAAVAAAETTSLWVATESGLYRIAEDATWEQVAAFYRSRVTAVYVSGDTVIGATPDRLLVSADRGRSWEAAPTPPEGEVTKLERAGDRIYALSGALSVSEDRGRTWERVPAAPSGITDLVVDPQNPSNILAATTVGVFASSDGARSWHVAPLWLADYKLAARADGGTTTMYAAAGGIPFFTDDAGRSWNRLARDPSANTLGDASGGHFSGDFAVFEPFIANTPALAVSRGTRAGWYVGVTVCARMMFGTECGSGVLTYESGQWSGFSFGAPMTAAAAAPDGSVYLGGDRILIRSDSARQYKQLRVFDATIRSLAVSE